MRLLLVTNDYPPRPGGIQQYLGNLVAAIDAEVLVVAPSDPSVAAEEPSVVRHERGFMWPTGEVRSFVESVARDFAPDAVLFGAPHPLPIIGPSLRRSLGVPYAVLAHGAEVTLPAAMPVVRGVLARALRSADVLFAVSRYTQRAVAALTRRAVTYVGAGVDVATFLPADHPPRNEPPIVGCVSRFVPRKGQDRLIEAAATLATPVELLFVGAGRTEVALRRLAAARGVRARFEISVPWDRLPSLYREMDLFCMPCHTRWGGLEPEGLGLVFLEAAASGLPVLAGDSGGAPETVLPGETGYVVGSVADIAEGIQMLIGDPSRAEAMGRVGRERVVAEFTWPKVAARFVRELDRVL